MYGEGAVCCALPPLSLYLPSQAKLWCKPQLRGQIHSPLFLLYPYMHSVMQKIKLSLNEWMNERTLFCYFLHWVPPCWHEKKNNSTRLDIFNRASHPVIICLRSSPLAQPLAERTWAGSGYPVLLRTLPRLWSCTSPIPSVPPPHFLSLSPKLPGWLTALLFIQPPKKFFYPTLYRS